VEKVISVIPLIFAGYEVGKTIEEADTKEIVKALRENKNNNEVIKKNDESPDAVEIFIAILMTVLVFAYIIKTICTTIKKRISRVVAREQQRI